MLSRTTLPGLLPTVPPTSIPSSKMSSRNAKLPVGAPQPGNRASLNGASNLIVHHPVTGSWVLLPNGQPRKHTASGPVPTREKTLNRGAPLLQYPFAPDPDDGSNVWKGTPTRSEERRVGKEWRCR